ncbi:MAG: dTDP-4-dehydrorhamnose reductase [bacterium]|nr:dTDP-4-dehydrorhamnose reductase [bacterium]
MKVAVIGAEGQLGSEVCQVFADCDVARIDLDGDGVHLDISDADAVNRVIRDEVRPDVVLNMAAAHNVPLCEEKPEWAFAVNATGAKNLAVACKEAGARLVHISTDYVFGHGHSEPLNESVPPEPLSVYGASKLAGEHLIAAYCDDYAVVRTAAIYGPAACRAKGGKNFVGLMLHLAASRPDVKVVTDEFTTPTYTVALARQLRTIAEKAEPGLYHATCQGACSWFEFAKAIFEETKTEVGLLEATQEDFPSPVQRPEYSVLDNTHLRAQGLDSMPDWREALCEYLTSHDPTK